MLVFRLSDERDRLARYAQCDFEQAVTAICVWMHGADHDSVMSGRVIAPGAPVRGQANKIAMGGGWHWQTRYAAIAQKSAAHSAKKTAARRARTKRLSYT